MTRLEKIQECRDIKDAVAALYHRCKKLEGDKKLVMSPSDLLKGGKHISEVNVFHYLSEMERTFLLALEEEEETPPVMVEENDDEF